MRTTIKALCSVFVFLMISCSSEEITPLVDVHWEHITNFTDKPDVFESKFTLFHQGGKALNDQNWTLFFNISPRTIVPTPAAQPGKLEHINGDWYKMTPKDGFSLTKGDSVEIYYRGIEATIKETDRPLGLYFVYYDEQGEEEEIVEVGQYTFAPFTKPDQMNRSAEDYDPIPTPEYLYKENQKLSLLSPDQQGLIIPTPVEVSKSAGSLNLDAGFVINYVQELESEAQFLKDQLMQDAGLSLPMIQTATSSKSISLSIDDISVGGKTEEVYRLSIDDTGIDITGSDPSGVFYGIQSLRSLMPLDALEYSNASLSLPHVAIVDGPRFGFRSLQLDVGRNFQSKATILRLLDIMAFYKLNHFLFYLTEDEGWRLEIEQLPELTEVGAVRRHTSSYHNSVLHPAYGSGPFANSDGKNGHGHYTRADFIDIIQYAHRRHIQVIPEVNFPAHARAAIKAMEYRYERLMQEGKPDEANEFRLIDPEDKSRYMSAQAYKDNVVSVVQEQTYHFYETVVEEILSMYQEAGVPISKFHIGGDEVPSGAWTGSPQVAEFMKDHPEIENHHALHAYFVKTMTDRLANKGLEWHGWEEVVLSKTADGAYVPNPALIDANVVPYIWNNLFDYPDIGYKLANLGYPIVLCNVSNFYFDLAYNKDPKEPGLYWAGFINERDSWTFAPFNMFRTTMNTSMGQDIHVVGTETRDGKLLDIVEINSGQPSTLALERLKPEARKNILGVEAQIWSETIKGRDMLEYYYLPKLIGFSESAWSAERPWENIDSETERTAMQDKAWNVFANQLAQKELPRLSYLNAGYNYRVPPPGAMIEDGYLKVNVEYPGMDIYYSAEDAGPESKSISILYNEPVQIKPGATVNLKSMDKSGKESRIVSIKNE
jgi:hexosaminidase